MVKECIGLGFQVLKFAAIVFAVGFRGIKKADRLGSAFLFYEII
ncbi:hypothetical protein [Turicibacter sp.]|nr:hypothetical protein [Turicibacter sp.]